VFGHGEAADGVFVEADVGAEAIIFGTLFELFSQAVEVPFSVNGIR